MTTILHARISEEGELDIQIPENLWGKKVVISMLEEVASEFSNWKAMQLALREVNKLSRPHKTYSEILTDLRTDRASECS